MLWMERQLGEIDILTRDLNLVHWGLGGRHLDQRLGICQPFEIFVVELVFAGLEGSRSRATASSRTFVDGNDDVPLLVPLLDILMGRDDLL